MSAGILTLRLFFFFFLSPRRPSVLWSRTNPSHAEPVVQALSSQFPFSLFTRQQPRPGATSLHPVLAKAQHNYRRDDAVYVCACVALLALNLGSGLFFKAVNIGQSRCLCKCRRPFIIANHVIQPGGLCFLMHMHTHTHIPNSISIFYPSNV